MQWSSADLIAMLAATGEVVTFGALSTNGVVRAADLEQFGQEDLPVSVISEALSVTIKRGSLSGLTEGSIVVIRSASFVVDRMLSAYSGDMTRFLAVAQKQEHTVSLSDGIDLSDATIAVKVP
jgi:hypothetical protein